MRRLAIATLILTAACDSAPSTVSNGSGEVTVLDASDVHALGTSDLIALVEDLDVLPDGGVWVLNSIEPLFIRLDATGAVVGAYGRVGGGPREFGDPAGFVEGGIDGGTWILDYPRNVLREIAGTDLPARQLSLPPESLPPGTVFGTNPFRAGVRTARLGNEVLIPRRGGYSASRPTATGVWAGIWTADIVALDVGGGGARDFLSLREVLGDPTGQFSVEGSGVSFPFWYRLLTVCSDDELRVYDRLQNQVRRFDREGAELGAVALPPVASTSVSRREFAIAAFDLPASAQIGEVPAGGVQMSAADSARILNDFLSRVTLGGAELANLLPRYVDLRCDSEGTQWIHPFDIDAPGSAFGGLRGGRVWLRTRADGRTDRVRLPDRFDVYRITPDRIWGVQRNELDVATVAWIETP
ncbi:MAG: hypothetical protein PVF19_16180 [Gemmatimonadota bacterium]|jgi:hypothetical protein